MVHKEGVREPESVDERLPPPCLKIKRTTNIPRPQTSVHITGKG